MRRWFGGVVAALVLSLGVVAGVPAPACACRCAPLSFQEYVDNADAVFAGRLLSGDTDGYDRPALEFEVSEVYKGDVTPLQKVVTPGDGASCGMEFSGPGPHLVFASKASEPGPREWQLVGSLCGGSRPLDAAARADLASLAEPYEPVAAQVEPTNAGSPAWWLGAAGAAVVVAVAAAAGLVWRRRRQNRG